MDVAVQTKLLGATDGKWGAGQGVYYKAMNGTPDTGVLSSTQQTFSTTSAIFEVENPSVLMSTDGSATGIYIIPDFVKLTVKTADVAGTAFQYCGVLDPKLRYNSGGTQPISPEIGPVNVVNMNTAQFMPVAAWHFGNIGLTAGGVNRLIMSRGCVKAQAAPVSVANDEFYFSFGQAYDVGAGAAKAGTTPAVYRQNIGPVCVPPQSSFALLAWFPAITTGITFEFEAGWWELPCGGTIGAQ